MYSIEITSNAAQVAASVPAAKARMLAAVAAALDLQNQLTIGHAQARYLTGPRPRRLGVVSNRLRGSLRASAAVVVGNTVDSAIGSNVRYAGAHENGFQGVVQVRGHRRRNKAGDILTGGAKVFDMATGRISAAKGGAKRSTLVASGVSFVRTHSRRMNVRPRPYIAPSVADRSPAYSAAISAAILTAAQDTLGGPATP